MNPWSDILVAGLWRAGWAVVPVALVVAAVCRFGKCNATTRHALWLTTFAGFIAAMWLPGPTVEPPPAPEPVYFVGSHFGGADTDGSPMLPFVPVVNAGRAKPYGVIKDNTATTAQVAADTEPTPPRTAACSADSSAAWLASTANRLRRLSIPLLAGFEQGREWIREIGSESCCAVPVEEPPSVDCGGVAYACNSDTPACGDASDSTLVSAATVASDWLASLPTVITDGVSMAKAEIRSAFASAAARNPKPDEVPELTAASNIATALSLLGSVKTTSNPDELDPWPGEPGAEFSAAHEWQRFASRLLDVRDAVGLVPPLPTTAWAVGFVSIAGLLLLRTMSAARRLRRVQPADAETLKLVEREARRLGLKSAPDTFMIDDRVSPLIWCGRRVRLILPRTFWSELDYDARRAVICHELAHLRRRDHWVRRLEILVTCLYWWHPVMWWAKARMAEEADACCDEWVTWVLPRERRAYARALLAATDFVSGSVAPRPLAVAMASARAAKIARRLTVIMTATRRPSLGLAGACGVFALAALAWVATPAQSCPPEEEGATTTQSRQHESSVAQTVKVRHTGETGDDEGMDEPVLADDAQMRDRLRKIEESQRRLAAELRELSKHLSKHGTGASAPAAEHGHAFSSTTPAPAAIAPLIAQQRSLFGAAPGAPGAYSAVIAGPRPGFEQPIVARKYKLSGDRLEALTELMVRDDVPVLVSPSDDGIEVQGTEAQQAVFAAFIKMITANEKAADIELPAEKMAAVKKLAALDSVPTRFNIGGDTISVLGSPAEQAVFDAFIALIHPKTPAGSSGGATPMATTISPFAPVAPVAPVAPAMPVTPAPAVRKAKPGKPQAHVHSMAPGGASADVAVAHLSTSAELAKARSEINSRRDELQKRRAELSAERTQLEGQADHLDAEADTLESRSESATDKEEAQRLKTKAREMRTSARQSRRTATRLESEIDKLADVIAEMEIKATEMGR